MANSFLMTRVSKKRKRIKSTPLFCLWLLLFTAKELTIGILSRLMILLNRRDLLRMVLYPGDNSADKLMIEKLQDNARIYMKQQPNLVTPVFDIMSHYIMCQGAFELFVQNCLQTVFARLDSTKTALDLGAHIGVHTCFFSRHFARTYAFELNPKIAKILQLNVELYAANDVEVIAKGASDKNGATTGYVVTNATGNTSLQADESYRSNAGWQSTAHEIVEQEFEVCRVDDVIPLDQHDKVAFIKIDVEGHEIQALRGMPEIIQKSKPVVGFEVLKNSFDAKGEQAVIQHLRDNGYQHFYEVDQETEHLVKRDEFPARMYHIIIASHHALT